MTYFLLLEPEMKNNTRTLFHTKIILQLVLFWSNDHCYQSAAIWCIPKMCTFYSYLLTRIRLGLHSICKHMHCPAIIQMQPLFPFETIL